MAECTCDEPLIRCDMHGMRCAVCGGEERIEPARPTVPGDAVTLAPCKFCGHPHIELEHDPVCFLGRRKYGVDASEGYRVRCAKCACQTCWWHTKDEAIAKWNSGLAPKPLKGQCTVAQFGHECAPGTCAMRNASGGEHDCERPAVTLPTGGAGPVMATLGQIPWSRLIAAVNDARGAGQYIDPSTHIGHQIPNINFNSLNRIVSAFVNEALETPPASTNARRWKLIDELRADEGHSVTLVCDNPDFNGQPNAKIICVGDWTGWKEREFAGDTVLACLEAAHAAMRVASQNPEEQR